MNTSPFWRRGALVASLPLVMALAACGDNPAEAPAPPPVADDTVPASATTSARAYVMFAASLPADDTGRPRRLDGVVPPTSDTSEPEPVN